MGRRPKTVGASGKVERTRFLRAEVPNLGKPQLPYLFGQPGGFEKAEDWLIVGSRPCLDNGQYLLGLFVEWASMTGELSVA